jgi:polyisoprenoid-binding protein YceI
MTTKKWALDPTHSELQFKVKHLMVSNVTGTIENFDVDIEAPEDSMEDAQIRFTADISSLSTRNKRRDKHLKSGDFFDAENYPHLKFESTSFKKIDDQYELKGNLTIRDVTNPVKLHVKYGGQAVGPLGNTKTGFSLSGKINRKDWGITHNAVMETGGVMIGEQVRLMAEVQLAEVKELVEA